MSAQFLYKLWGPSLYLAHEDFMRTKHAARLSGPE